MFEFHCSFCLHQTVETKAFDNQSISKYFAVKASILGSNKSSKQFKNTENQREAAYFNSILII